MQSYFTQEKILAQQTRQTHSSDTSVFQNKPFNPICTLVGRPSEEIRNKIYKVAEQLRASNPEHYFYDPSQYHFTVMGDVALNDSTEAFEQKYADILHGYSLFPIYRGLHLNTKSVFVAIYFENDALHQLRASLRTLNDSFYDYSTFLEGLDHVAWLNILRFSKPFSQNLKEEVLFQGETFFGKEDKVQFELYATTSLVLSDSESRLISAYP